MREVEQCDAQTRLAVKLSVAGSRCKLMLASVVDQCRLDAEADCMHTELMH